MWERACPRWRCISQLMYRLTLSHRGIGIYTTLLSSAYWVCVHIRCCGHGHLGFRPDGQRGLTGRLRSKARSKAEQQQQQQQSRGAKLHSPLWELACLRRRCISQYIYRLIHRLRRQASSHRYMRTSRRSGRLSGRLALLLILGAPLNHAGRQGGTLSRHNRSNGYVHKPKNH